MSPSPARRAALGLALLSALAFAARAVHLSEQPLIADDASVGLTARQFTETGLPEPTMWNHPRLRDSLVAVSLAALGDTAWGLKAWSVVLGALAAPAIALLVLAVGGGGAAALVAGLLVAVDPLHLDFSRQAINDVYCAFFPVAALAAAWRYRASRRTGWLALAGTLFGLGIASKWSAAFPLALTALVVTGDSVRRPASPRERAAELGFATACLAALPATVYLLTFLPWFDRGYSLAEWLRFQGAMALETATHTGYAGTKRPGYAGEVIQAWRWFVQPVYYADVSPPQPPAGPTFIVGLSNPVTWLAVWPSAAVALWRAWRLRDRVAALLVAFFAVAYLPFALASRPIWTNSAVGVVPFAMALVGYAASTLRESRPRLAAAWVAVGVVCAAALWFPAAGLRSRWSEPYLRAVVPPIALVPKDLESGDRRP